MLATFPKLHNKKIKRHQTMNKYVSIVNRVIDKTS